MSDAPETPLPIKERLRDLRGGAYFECWKDWWGSPASALVHIAIWQQIASGSFIIADLVRICDRFDLPWKTLVEQLEKDRICPTGTYDRLPPLAKLRAVVAKKDEVPHATA